MCIHMTQCLCVHVLMAADGWSSITTDRRTVHLVERLGCVDYSKDSMTLSLSLSLSLSLCLFFLLSPLHQTDEWLSLSISSHSALSSSVSLLALSFLCRISDLSLTPTIPQSTRPSVCQMSIYLCHLFFHSSIHPSIL